MALSQKQKEAHAIRLIRDELRDFEFSYVYEDEELEYVSKDDQLAIHDLITSAKVQVIWE